MNKIIGKNTQKKQHFIQNNPEKTTIHISKPPSLPGVILFRVYRVIPSQRQSKNIKLTSHQDTLYTHARVKRCMCSFFTIQARISRICKVTGVTGQNKFT